MHPWSVGVGLTCALAALAVLLGFERLAFLRPYTSLIWEQYSGLILAHLLVLFLSVAAGIHYPARLLDLGNAGLKVELAVRRGQGDPERPPPCKTTVKGNGDRLSCRIAPGFAGRRSPGPSVLHLRTR